MKKSIKKPKKSDFVLIHKNKLKALKQVTKAAHSLMLPIGRNYLEDDLYVALKDLEKLK